MGNEISIERISAELDSDRAIWAAVAKLCCRTGNDGNPISTERWELFERIWIEPYRMLIPQWSYVALADRRVVGYLTGCPDTSRFYRQRFVRCTLPLLRQIVFGRYHGDPYGKRFARQALRLETSAERSVAKPIRRRLLRQFPAHLHMNVDSDYRYAGVGTRLVGRFVNDLQDERLSGVHLFCGAAPVPFYARMGFSELAVVSVRGNSVHVMVKKI
jgi:GNAT superfamily N-acetyltransferase